MTTKEYLNQAYRLDQRIQSKQEQIASLNDLATSCSATMTGMPRNPNRGGSRMADMADSVTGGGLHGQDLSKADVSVNIYAWLKAQQTGKPVELCCAIGDYTIDGKPYSEIVETAQKFISDLGGFEKFAEWGLF